MQSSKVFLLGFVIAVSTAASAVADGGGQYYDHSMMGGGWFFGPIMMLLFIGLIVAAIVLTVRFLGFDASNRSSNNSLDILRERFAKGEIDKDEFEERKRIMSS
jgi:putative membrane protein